MNVFEGEDVMMLHCQRHIGVAGDNYVVYYFKYVLYSINYIVFFYFEGIV